MFLPFVENAVKHSMSTDDDNETINIKLTATPETLELDVSNSKGFNRLLELKKDYGFGLDNVRKKRLTLLYPSKHELNVSETENQYNVKLIINK